MHEVQFLHKNILALMKRQLIRMEIKNSIKSIEIDKTDYVHQHLRKK